jgi:hypothetical protein
MGNMEQGRKTEAAVVIKDGKTPLPWDTGTP